jgi:uncharacterized protein
MIARLTMRYAMVVFVALAMIGAAKPAAAQTQAPAAAASVSPGAILLAKQIVEIKDTKAMFQPMVSGIVEKARQTLMQTNFMWAKDINEVAVMVHKQYDPRVNEVVDASARIYASHFTEAELKDILAFYQSPLGRKMIVEEPKTIHESISSAGEWAEKVSDDILASMRTELRKRGHDM